MPTASPLKMDDAFLAALQGEDALGAVVRAHIHIEASVIEYVEAAVPTPDQLPNLRYQQRVQLACALGLGSERAPPLKILGELRNAFAHKLTTTLTMESVDRLRNSLSPFDREAVEASYKGSHKIVIGDSGPDFDTVDPKIQFMIIAITLKAMLMVAVKKKRSGASVA